eukprot:47890-Eustigmatos_ZCMA.PRE.1
MQSLCGARLLRFHDAPDSIADGCQSRNCSQTRPDKKELKDGIYRRDHGLQTLTFNAGRQHVSQIGMR